MSLSFGAGGDLSAHFCAKRCSQRRIVEWDFSRVRAVARTPRPSVRIFKAIDTVAVEVRNRAIGVPVRSLKRLPQFRQRYLCTQMPF
jgi:hypothetical protein